MVHQPPLQKKLVGLQTKEILGRQSQSNFQIQPYCVLQTPALSPYIVNAIDEETIWVGLISLPQQNYGTIARSNNGGESWERVSLPLIDSQEVPIGIHFFDPDTGLIISHSFSPVELNPIRIYITHDSGESYTLAKLPNDSSAAQSILLVETLFDTQGDTLWYGTRNGEILRTPDKGKTWKILKTGYGDRNSIRSIAFQDALNGLAVVDVSPFEFFVPSNLIRTRDGGESWERLPAPNFIENVFFVEGSGGVFLGSLGLFGRPGYVISRDFGETWTFELPIPMSLAFNFPKPERGYFSSMNIDGGVHTYVGEPLIFDPDYTNDLPFEGKALPTLPDSYIISDIDIVSKQVIWAIANDQTFINQSSHPEHFPIALLSTDGGENWEALEIEEAKGRISLDIFAFDDKTAWLTTQNNDSLPGKGLFVTDDGGTSWEENWNESAAAEWDTLV